MKIDDITFDMIDIYGSPVEYVVAAYYNYVKENCIIPMNGDKTLCGDAGTEVVFVFGFKGTFDEVFVQLADAMDDIIHEVATEDLRERVIGLYNKHIQFVTAPKENPFHPEYVSAMKRGDTEVMRESFVRMTDWNQRMHENKQCLCFSNH